MLEYARKIILDNFEVNLEDWLSSFVSLGLGNTDIENVCCSWCQAFFISVKAEYFLVSLNLSFCRCPADMSLMLSSYGSLKSKLSNKIFWSATTEMLEENEAKAD